MKYIVTRHTTTPWNTAGKIQGQTDICLSDQGKQEAMLLAELLRHEGIQCIISSDLQRAKETSDIINTVLGVPILYDARLRECSFGEVEGLTKQEAVERYGQRIESNWEDQCYSFDFRSFGGEHRDAVFSRHYAVCTEAYHRNNNAVVLLVGHGRGLATLLAGLGYSPELKRGEYRIIEYTDSVIT